MSTFVEVGLLKREKAATRIVITIIIAVATSITVFPKVYPPKLSLEPISNEPNFCLNSDCVLLKSMLSSVLAK